MGINDAAFRHCGLPPKVGHPSFRSDLASIDRDRVALA